MASYFSDQLGMSWRCPPRLLLAFVLVSSYRRLFQKCATAIQEEAWARSLLGILGKWRRGAKRWKQIMPTLEGFLSGSTSTTVKS